MQTHTHTCMYSTIIVLTGSECSSSSSSSRGHRTSNRRTWCSLRKRWTSHCSRWRAYFYPVNWNNVRTVKPNNSVQIHVNYIHVALKKFQLVHLNGIKLSHLHTSIKGRNLYSIKMQKCSCPQYFDFCGEKILWVKASYSTPTRWAAYGRVCIMCMDSEYIQCSLLVHILIVLA